MRYFLIPLVLFLAACQATYDAPPVTERQAALIANPTSEVLEEVERNLPAFLSEDIAVEKAVFAIGRGLTPEETKLARALGVRFPERVRIAVIPRIPGDDTRQEVIERYAGLRFTTLALAAGYGILLSKHAQNSVPTLAHELVHVRQFERLGREGLARQVLIERAVLRGITVIPIEQEAIFDSARVLGIEPAYYPY